MIKMVGVTFLALGLFIHFLEWLFEFHGNGWSFATVLSVVVVIERIHHNHQTRYMLHQIGEKVGVEWQSNLRLTGLKRIYPKLISGLPKDLIHLKRRKRKMNNQNINYMTLIPTILGAAKLILQTFGIDIPDETINEVVNGAAAVGTIIGIFLVHQKGGPNVKPTIDGSADK